MAFSEIYVDPSIAGDSGTGTIGDPFGDLEYAIEQTTFDTTNGTRVNIKAGTDEVLAAALETALADTGTSVAWAPSEAAPCVFQGYTSVAGDGGVGGISGGGSVSVMGGDAFNWIKFIDLHLHNTGGNDIISLDNDITILRCELNDTTVNAIDLDTSCIVQECYVHDFGNYGVVVSNDSLVRSNYIDEEGATGTYAVRGAFGVTVENNIINIGVTNCVGILVGEDMVVDSNSIYCSVASTTDAMQFNAVQPAYSVSNNLIEGFSGVGGSAIDMSGATVYAQTVKGNAVFNCTTAYDGIDSGSRVIDASDNETLTASPFNDAANGDFSPVDTGNVKEGSLPNVIGL